MIKLLINLVKLIVAACVSLFFASCNYQINLGNGIKGDGIITSEIRQVSENFENIEVSQGIKVVLTQSSNKSVSVETDKNIQKNIITKVEKGVLIIEADENYNTSKAPVVTINMPYIKELKASSASEITSTNTIKSNNIAIEASSGSEINVNSEAEKITLKASSGSEIAINGKAINLEVDASSGSNVKASKLLANTIRSKASSGSSVDVYPILSLDANASSGSSIDYYNNPKMVKKEKNSAGSVNQK